MTGELSRRQREVLFYLGQGKTISEIGLILGISLKTAHEHRTRLLSKLQLENTPQLIRYAIIKEIEL